MRRLFLIATSLPANTYLPYFDLTPASTTSLRQDVFHYAAEAHGIISPLLPLSLSLSLCLSPPLQFAPPTPQPPEGPARQIKSKGGAGASPTATSRPATRFSPAPASLLASAFGMRAFGADVSPALSGGVLLEGAQGGAGVT
jgi:hypothetical protein